MEAQQRVFFDFLKFCIGATPSIPETLCHADWRGLYATARKQALLGVLFHGIRQLPKDLAPDTALLMQWMGMAQKIRQQNVRLFVDSARVAKRFGQEGFRSCILKGQGNALLYPDPYMRTPGDIDIYVAGGRRRVMEYVDRVCPGQTMRYHHVDFPVMATAIEVHFTPSYMFFPLHNRRMQRWFGRVMDLQCSNRVALPDGYGEISVPTRSFNAIYILSHLYRHVFTEGIGLRQLLDYFYVLSEERRVKSEEFITSDSSFSNTESTENTESRLYGDKNIQSAELKRNLNGNITSDTSFSNTESSENTESRLYGDKNIQSAELKRNLNGNITSGSSFLNTNNANCTNNACSAIQSAELKRNLNGTISSDSSFSNTNNANNTNNACSAIQSAELKRNLNGTITSGSSFLNTNCTNNACSAIQSAELKRNLNGNITSGSSFSNTENTECTEEGDGLSVESFSNTENTERTEEGDGQSVESVKSVGEKKKSPSEGKNNPSAGDKDYPLRRELEHLGLWKFAGAVMWVMHEVFGLAESQMIAPMNATEGRFLLDEVIRGGNFGQYDDRLGDKTGEGKLHRYFRMTLRNLRFVKHYPTEALSEPLFRTGFAVWKKMRT